MCRFTGEWSSPGPVDPPPHPEGGRVPEGRRGGDDDDDDEVSDRRP